MHENTNQLGGAYSVSCWSGHCRLRSGPTVVMAVPGLDPGIDPAIHAEAPQRLVPHWRGPQQEPANAKVFGLWQLTCGRSTRRTAWVAGSIPGSSPGTAMTLNPSGTSLTLPNLSSPTANAISADFDGGDGVSATAGSSFQNRGAPRPLDRHVAAARLLAMDGALRFGPTPNSIGATSTTLMALAVDLRPSASSRRSDVLHARAKCRFQRPSALILRRPLRKQRASKDAPEGRLQRRPRHLDRPSRPLRGALRTRAVGF